MLREHTKPQENQAMAPFGRDVQVTVTTTIEWDIESRLPVYENLPALPSRMEDKDKFHPLELTEEEQIRILEHQMKQDLDI